MPELPEVETTLRGITPHIQGQQVTEVVIRHPQLRWPIPDAIRDLLPGEVITEVARRGKYLLLHTARGTVIMHLGMSGRLRYVASETAIGKHDHVDIQFGDHCLRLTDPRRFGAVLFTDQAPLEHKLLAHLGPEPLSSDFSAAYLFKKAAGRRSTIKSFIMDSKIVVGVGNIYACESLFRAGIHPERAAGKISLPRYEKLAQAIVEVLSEAIQQGGTTLKDFQKADGKPGYFQQSLMVYGRDDEACLHCGSTLKLKRLQGRATVFCSRCQR